MIAARAIGAAERALRAAVEWAGERRQFGQRLLDYQLIQGMIADSVVDIPTNRALVHQVAWEADQGLERKPLHAKAAVVKLAASEAAGRVVDRALQIYGGRGYMRENLCERLYRDLRVDRIWEGTTEIQRLIVANEVATSAGSTACSPTAPRRGLAVGGRRLGLKRSGLHRPGPSWGKGRPDPHLLLLCGGAGRDAAALLQRESDSRAACHRLDCGLRRSRT